jgi:serine/threonine-protein kinase RsbW
MIQKFQFEFEGTDQTQRASRSRPSVELQHSFPSQVAAISPTVDLVMRFVSTFRKVDGSEAKIEIALHEALANAVVHGNHEDPNQWIFIGCLCSIDGEVSITVRDQGSGFDSRVIPDPTDPENHMSAYGRGIYLMRVSMDEVCFDEGGAVVHMRKKPNTASPRPLTSLEAGATKSYWRQK